VNANNSEAKMTHVALLVTTERAGTTDSGLGAVSGSVTSFTTVVALHRRSLNSLVLALVGSVTGLLAVVTDVGSLLLTTLLETTGSTSAGGTSRGDVAKATTVVAGLATTASLESTLESTGTTGTALGTVSADVAFLTTPVALAGRSTSTVSTSTTGTGSGGFSAFGGDVAGLTAL
jgi:hypothetical protein